MGGTMTASQVDAQVHYHSVIAKAQKGSHTRQATPIPHAGWVGGK